MKKLIILVLLFESIYCNTAWNLWTTVGPEIKLSENFKTAIEIENRFQNDFSDYHLNHIEAMIGYKILKNNYIGPMFRQITEKKGVNNWEPESRLGIIWTNKFTLSGLPFSTRVKGIYRILTNKPNVLALRALLGTDILRIKPVSLYITEEIFYHYNKLNQVDRNRLAVGLKIETNISKMEIELKTYYLRQENKPSANARWSGINVIGLKLAAKF